MGNHGASSGKGSLTEQEAQAIRNYTNTAYESVNNWLRLDRDWESRPILSNTIHSLDSAIQKSTISEPTVVYRGVSLDELGIRSTSELSSLDGKEITNKGFMSTSATQRTADAFVNKMRFQDDIEGVVVRIKLPASKGLARDVSGESSHGSYESEYLFKRGVRIKYSYRDGVLEGTIMNP